MTHQKQRNLTLQFLETYWITFRKFCRQKSLLTIMLMGFCSNSVLAAELLTLNFTDTDINAVIGAVSEMTGQNFIVDPRVKGKVTIISSSGMSPDDIYQVFLSVLKVHGFAAIPGKHVVKIVPEVNAKQDAVPTLTKRHTNMGDEFVTQVVEVKYVNAAQLVPILRPLVPQRGHLAAYPSSNILVISDSAANISRLMAIIERIDQATSEELEIIELKYASASEIVRVINQLVRQDAKSAATNGKVKIVADDRTNSILLGGDKSRRIKLRAIIAHLDTEVDVGGATHVVYLHYAKAKDLVKVLTGVSKNLTKKGKRAPKAAGPTGKTNVSIQADETTNALVIHSPPDIFRTLRKVIQKLDIRRAQILIEGVLADVSVNAASEFGVSWAAAKIVQIDGQDKLASDAPVGVVDFNNTVSNIIASPTGVPQIGSGLSVFAGNLSGATKIGALITALASDSSTNIISTPSILTMDNEEAEIVVGSSVPFTTGSFANTGGSSGSSSPGNPFQTIERENVGLTLRITPQVNEGDAIKLDVEQEFTALSGSSIGGQPITTKRSIKTSIMVDDGQMIALGGLIDEKLIETEQRVPLLGDIPILGWFFKYQNTTKEKNNFMLFLNPKILKDAAMQTAVTGEKYNYLRAGQLGIRERGVRLMADEESPLLPEFQEYLKLPSAYGQPKSTATENSEAESLETESLESENSENSNNNNDEEIIDDSHLDETADDSSYQPPSLDEVSSSYGLTDTEKLLYQSEQRAFRNRQAIRDGDVF